MQFLIAASLLVAGTNAQLVAYANGAVAPFDPNNAKATAEHQKAIAEAGGVNFPFGVHATGVVVPHVYAAHPLVYGKRDADAQLVHHPNGAITPHDPNLAAATAAHLATKGYGVYGYPYHYGVYGKREADAQLVHHANGAVTPYDPNLAIATNAHLATRFGYGYYGHPVVYGKREAQIPVGLVTGYSAVHAGYPFHYGYGVAPVVSPFVAHPNGALVPAEPKDVVDARAEHLAAHAEA